MSSDNLLIDYSNSGIVTISLNRPHCHNAFDEDLIEELQTILIKIDQDKAVRVVVLAAQGKHFSAGADLNWMKKMANYNEQENIQDAMKLRSLLKTLYSMSKPTIGLAHGSTLGGGVGLLACCDIVLAEETATFCFSEVKLGLIPATISPYIIRAIGVRAAQFLFMTAKKFDARQAEQLGLVQEVVPAGRLVEACDQLCNQLLANGPEALKITKQWLNKIQPLDDDLLTESAKLIAEVRISDEAQEGLTAFFEKRKANWNLQ